MGVASVTTILATVFLWGVVSAKAARADPSAPIVFLAADSCTDRSSTLPTPVGLGTVVAIWLLGLDPLAALLVSAALAPRTRPWAPR